MVVRNIKIAGKRLVIMEEADYQRLLAATGSNLKDGEHPLFGPRDPSQRRPAAVNVMASIARDIAAERKEAGLTQHALAKKASIRQETLSRIESGKHTPTLRTLKKIDKALEKTD